MLPKLFSALANLSFASFAAASDLQKSEHPRLKDWFEASWFSGVVQIPLVIRSDWKTLWIADLVMINEDVGAY